MPEIILELSLNRSSGVLAGIVASLAQAGIELKSQKLQRATEGRGGWLTITGSGDVPESAVLAERLNGARGVEKLMRVIVDGQAILADGKPLDDQIEAANLAEGSATSHTGPVEHLDTPHHSPAGDQAREVHVGVSDAGDLPILSEPEATEDSPIEPETETQIANRAIDADPAEQQPLDAEVEIPEQDGPAPEFAAETTEESDFADALHGEAEPAEAGETSTSGSEVNDSVEVGAVLRIRRRRRR